MWGGDSALKRRLKRGVRRPLPGSPLYSPLGPLPAARPSSPPSPHRPPHGQGLQGSSQETLTSPPNAAKMATGCPPMPRSGTHPSRHMLQPAAPGNTVRAWWLILSVDKHTRTTNMRETSHLGHSGQKTTKPKNNNKTRKTQREVRKQKNFSLKKTIIKVLEIRTDTTSTGGGGQGRC